MKIDFNQWGKQEESKEIDFQAIKSLALGNIETVLNQWLPGGKIVRGEYLCGTMQGGDGQSCSTNIRSGVGSDFSTGDSWGDLIDLVAQRENIKMSEAAKLLQDFLSAGSNIKPPAPVIPVQPENERYEHGKTASAALWMSAEQCPPTHPYLLKKQIPPDAGIRLHTATDTILIPLRDEKREMWSVQRITPDGEKKVSHNGKLTGNFHVISGDQDTVYICEGYATAQTVAIATGKTTVMAVSTGNLCAVGEKIARLYPYATLIFAADNDNNSEKNPGITAAQKAVDEIGRGVVIAPPAEVGAKVDWNDYAILYGAEACRNILLSKSSSSLFIDVKTIQVTEPKFLIEDCIETPCTGMVFGPSGSGKSFFVLDLALHIVCGKKWMGKQVLAGPVLYICGEGRHAIPRRVKAWEHEHNIEIPHNCFFSSALRVDLSPESTRQIIAEVQSMPVPPVAVFIDTMARALPGDADENSSKDVGAFIDECDRLQQHFDCAVIIVHHTGHADSASKRARGSSALKGAMDVEILVQPNGELTGVLEWTKTKDMEPHHPIAFTRQKVQYGEGKRDNSCVMKYDLNYDPTAKNTTKREKVGMDSLLSACHKLGMPSVTVDTWRDEFYEMFGGSQSNNRQAFNRAKKDLVDAGKIKIEGSIVSIIKAEIVEDMTTTAIFSGLMNKG